ncbi:MAG: hypothetical protein JSW41_05375 [Candidatus Aenigmatarchaeota archaeon]|nr:MAG: hypothetical protein JSW41_05375 [Candidatus Aenigmarchaeota archaeon]
MILIWTADTQKTGHGKWDPGDRIDTKLHGVPFKIVKEWKKKKLVKEIRPRKKKVNPNQ